VAERAKSLAELNLRNAMRCVVLDVQNTFVDVLLAKDTLALAESNQTLEGVVEADRQRALAGQQSAAGLLRTRLAAMHSVTMPSARNSIPSKAPPDWQFVGPVSQYATARVYRNQGEVERARLERRQLEQRLRAARNSAAGDVECTYEQYAEQPGSGHARAVAPDPPHRERILSGRQGVAARISRREAPPRQS